MYDRQAEIARDASLGLIECNIFAGEDSEKAEGRRCRVMRKAVEAGVPCPVCCETCGRALRPCSGFEVYVVYGHMLAPVEHWLSGVLEEHPGHMGIFEIGPECAKRVPAAYKAKREKAVA